MRIDVHQHLWTEPLVDALRRRREPPLVRREPNGLIAYAPGEQSCRLGPEATDTMARAELVGRDGLDLALVAISSPLGIEALPPRESTPLIEAYLDGVAALPACFGAWGAVPVSRPDAAAVDEVLNRGCVGLSIPAGAVQDPRGLDRCAVLLDRLEQRNAALFVHPGPGPGTALRISLRPPTDWWAALTDYVAQMHAAWHAFMAFGRRQHPHLRVVFALLAGGAPLHLERLAARGGPVEPALDSNIFFDTSSYGPRAIDAMLRCVGVDQLVYGSDRPVVSPVEPLLGDAAVQSLREANPARLLTGVRAPVIEQPTQLRAA